MTKNIHQLIWNKRFKGVNITINDNKRLIKMFQDKYQQFLFRHKGTEINSKEDIINLLNRKPRSFLTTLNLLVKTFKQYDNRLTAHISKLHPKQITNLTKKTTTDTFIDKNEQAGGKNFLLQIPYGAGGIGINSLKSSIAITKLSNSKLISPKKETNFEILTEKIKNLTTSLQNNKLAIPLDLFNPLLKINSSYAQALGLNKISSHLNKTPIKYVEKPETKFVEIFGPNVD